MQNQENKSWRSGIADTNLHCAEASRAVLQETGLLPHVNAGVLTRDEFAALKTVSGMLADAKACFSRDTDLPQVLPLIQL